MNTEIPSTEQNMDLGEIIGARGGIYCQFASVINLQADNITNIPILK